VYWPLGSLLLERPQARPQDMVPARPRRPVALSRPVPEMRRPAV